MKTEYYCTNETCSHTSPNAMLKCPQCGEFGTHKYRTVENLIAYATAPIEREPVTNLADVQSTEYARLSLCESGIDRVLGGGGIVTSSCVYFCGSPGCGKSTIVSMCAGRLSHAGYKSLYFHLEEGKAQIKKRMERLGFLDSHSRIELSSAHIVENMIQQIQVHKPDLVIVDSLQKVRMKDPMGEATHMKIAAATFSRKAKDLGIPIVLIGHITKDDKLAGPRMVEHEVDAIMMFEKLRISGHRSLGLTKNRDGNDRETALYRMTDRGLVEIDESDFFMLERSTALPGVSITAAVNGTKTILCEVQTLLSPVGSSDFIVSGYDANRFRMLAAVANKHGLIGSIESKKSIMGDVPGGFTIQDRGADLAWIAALHSSVHEYVIPEDTVLLGEVDLSGHVRSIADIEQRLDQIRRLRFNRVLVPLANMRNTRDFGLELIGVRNIKGACETIRDLAGS